MPQPPIISTSSNTISLGEDIVIIITKSVGEPYTLFVNEDSYIYGGRNGLPLTDGNIVYTPNSIGVYELYIEDSNSVYSNTITVTVNASVSHWYDTIVEAVKTSVWNKITSSISAHNSSNSAHSDIRSSIPSASSSTPSSDTTNGSVGDGTTWARSNHTHPKSSLYAEASHTHNNYLTSHQDITGKEDKSNKVTSWTPTTTDTNYPSEKLVKDSLDGKANSNHNHTDYVYSNWDKGTGVSSYYFKNKNLVTNNSGTVVLEEKNNHYHGHITNDGYLDGVFTTINELSIIEPHISNYSGNECLYILNGKLVYDGDNEILVYDKEGFTELGELDESSEIATLDDIPNVTDKEDKSNKVTSLSSSSTNLQYPSAKVVYDTLNGKVDKENGKGLFTGSYTDLTDKPSIPSSSGDLSDGSSLVKKSNTVGLIKNDGSIDTNTYLTSHQSLDSKTVSIEKQANAETGYTATYVLKQGGTALSPKINIPKDYLVKSASLETVGVTPTTLETDNNLTTNDKYLKFIVNTQENDDSTTLVIPVSELVDTYTADNTTIELTNNVFSVKSNVFADKVHTHNQYLTEHQSLTDYIQKSNTSGLVKNDGTIDTNTYLTQHQDITGKEDKSNKSSSITTDTGSTIKYPTVKAVEDYAQPIGNYLTSHQDLTNYIQKNNTNGLIKNDGTIDTSSYLTSHQDITGKVNTSDLVGTFTELKKLITNASSGDTIVLEKNYKNTDNVNISINKSLTIIGNGHIIDGNKQHEYFMIMGNGSVSYNIENVIFTNFTQSNGAIQGINNSALSGCTLNIQYCTFINNKNGIWQIGDANRNISNCVFINHSTYAINVPTPLTTINCTFINSPINPTYVTNKNYLTEHQDITGKEDSSNKVTSLSSSSTDTQYPSAKVVYDSLNNKADSSDFDTVTVTVTYTDNTTENLVLYKQTTQNQS